MDNRIHEFQPGVIYAYRNLPKLVKQNAIHIFKTGDITLKNYYFALSKRPVAEFVKLLSKYKILSPYYIESLNPKTLTEISYDLNEVFSKDFYKTSKKYYKHVTRGINFF